MDGILLEKIEGSFIFEGIKQYPTSKTRWNSKTTTQSTPTPECMSVHC